MEAVAVVTTSSVSRLTTGCLPDSAHPESQPHASCRSVAVELVVQRLEADPEHIRGPGLVVAVGRERLEDELALGLLQARPDREATESGPSPPSAAPAGVGDGGMCAGRMSVGLADDDRALESVAQLAHIAGPGLRHERAQRGLVDRA